MNLDNLVHTVRERSLEDIALEVAAASIRLNNAMRFGVYTLTVFVIVKTLLEIAAFILAVVEPGVG